MYTKPQLDALEKCRSGMHWTFHQCGKIREDDLMRSLIAEGLIQARCDIAEDMYCLTLKGESVLEDREKLIEHPNDIKEIHKPQEHEPCSNTANKLVKFRKIWGAIAAAVCFAGSIFGIIELIEWLITKIVSAVP